MSVGQQPTGKKIYSAYSVGTIVTLGRECLGNAAGSKGVVYEHYSIGNETCGCSIIFPNGNYDGFSEKCLELFEVNPVGKSELLSDYIFENVSVLDRDFKRGLFERYLK